MATVQKVYLTHPKYTYGKRSQKSLRTSKRPASRSVSLMNTPLHVSRVRSGRDSLQSTPLHIRTGKDRMLITPLHTTRSGRDRHRLCEDECSQWRGDWDRQARQ